MSGTKTPGHNPERLLRLMRESVDRCNLDLRDSVILTEAAIGAYVVTPIIAAMAGAARVYAVTRDSRYGTIAEVTAHTRDLANQAGVEDRLRIITEKSPQVLHEADIVTNSGHVRPIDQTTVRQLKATAVVPLMYEAWEYRSSDIDLAACRARGIAVAGTNERHPSIDVFSYLGVMAVKLLVDAGVPVFDCRVMLVCDNPFKPYLEHGLRSAGADVHTCEEISEAPSDRSFDAIVVALRPGATPRLDEAHARAIASRWKGVVLAQFWGDVRRSAFAKLGIPCWPAEEPLPGHMAILPSALGPDAVVRLQCGGLKVGELMWRARRTGDAADKAVRSSADAGFGEPIS